MDVLPPDPILPPPPAADPEATFAQLWEIRDDVVRQVWGGFDAVYRAREPAPAGDPYVYVSEIPPEAQARPAGRWTYVTGGLALPWTADLAEVNADDYSATRAEVTAEYLAATTVGGVPWSGYGCELVLHTPSRAPWAVPLLHTLGAYVLRTGQAFKAGTRIPLAGPIIRDSDSALRVLLCAPPGDRAPLFKLPSGFGAWLVVLGITEAEWEFAGRAGSAALITALRSAGLADLTDPARSSIFA